MKLVTANTKAGAVSLNAKALAYVREYQNANASAWSDTFTNGSKFGVLYDDSIRSAFTNSELLGITEGERARVINGETVGDWGVVP